MKRTAFPAYETKSAESRDAILPLLSTLVSVRAAAAVCQACPLWRHATQTVFGDGAAHAKVVIVGEQPGDKEDLEGKPFVGPAGLLLRQAMEEASLDPDQVYVTNAVKHFKFEVRGKRRIHQKPGVREVRVCYPWLKRELELIAPPLVLLLGATAMSAVLGKAGTVAGTRGKSIALATGGKAVVTVHPSSLLRIPDAAAKKQAYRQFVKDLTVVRRLVTAVKSA